MLYDDGSGRTSGNTGSAPVTLIRINSGLLIDPDRIVRADAGTKAATRTIFSVNQGNNPPFALQPGYSCLNLQLVLHEPFGLLLQIL